MALVLEEDADDTGTSDGLQHLSRARARLCSRPTLPKFDLMSWNDALSHRAPPTFRLLKLRSKAAHEG